MLFQLLLNHKKTDLHSRLLSPLAGEYSALLVTNIETTALELSDFPRKVKMTESEHSLRAWDTKLFAPWTVLSPLTPRSIARILLENRTCDISQTNHREPCTVHCCPKINTQIYCRQTFCHLCYIIAFHLNSLIKLGFLSNT